jgi:transcription factor E
VSNYECKVSKLTIKSKSKSKQKTSKKATGKSVAKVKATPKKSMAAKAMKITAKLAKKGVIKSVKSVKISPKTEKRLKLANGKKAPLKKPEPPRMPDERALQKERERTELMEIDRLNVVLQDSYARQLLIDLAGENSLEIVRTFKGHPSDDDIAKKLKIKISDVRATLNKLHSTGLVSYFRDKDNETGWYSYSWNLNRARIKAWVLGSIESKHKEYLESGDHYFCLECGMDSITPFESASESSFKCMKCNNELDFLDKERLEQLIKWKK